LIRKSTTINIQNKMEELLNYIVKAIFPETEIKIETSNKENSTVFTLFVPKEEIGRVIGKDGKVINSIKQLLKVRAMKENAFVEVEIKEQ